MFSDWFDFFWKQIENIHTIQPGIYNIPWLFVAMQPFRIIGMVPGLIFVQAASFYVIFKLGQEFKLSKTRMVLVFLSAPVVWNFFMGQIDGILVGAYLLPPTFAVLFALFKPQTGLWAGWNGIKQKPFLILMVMVLTGLAYLFWLWPLSMPNPEKFITPSLFPAILVSEWNWSLWPWGILLTPWVLLKDKQTGMFLSPFLFPYIGLQSLIGPVLAAAARAPGWLFLLFWLLLWIRWAWMVNLF